MTTQGDYFRISDISKLVPVKRDILDQAIFRGLVKTRTISIVNNRGETVSKRVLTALEAAYVKKAAILAKKANINFATAMRVVRVQSKEK